MAPPTVEEAVNGTPNLDLSGDEEKEPSVAKLVKNINTIVPFDTQVQAYEDAKKVRSDFTIVPFDTPVQAYEDYKKVPSDFLSEDPRAIPNRIWGGQDNAFQQNDIALPLIDMSPLMNQGANAEGAKNVIAEIGKACEEWGYFQAFNHGIPESLLDRLLQSAGEFFRLPLEEKNAYALVGGKEGYGRLQGRSWRYWSDMMRHTVRPKLSPEEVEKRMPAKPTEYRALIEEYTQALEKLLKIVWTSLSIHLGLQPTALQKQQEDGDKLVIRMNYYPKCPEPEKVMGLGAHQDFGSITVLLMDQVGGLQVRKPVGDKPLGDNVWFDVKPIKGTLLVSLGIQVEHLSNGRFKGMWHRALVNQNEPRLSMAAFAFPGLDCIIGPVQELLEKSQEAPRFKQHRFGDFYLDYATDLKAGVEPHARYDIITTTA